MPRCAACGFQYIGISREIQMRHSSKLQHALEEFGRRQAEWYESIFDIDLVYFNKYCAEDEFRDYLTGPLENLTKSKSPETLAGLPRDKHSFSLVALDHVEDRSQFYPGMKQAIFEQLEARHLTGHKNCLRLVNHIIRYPDGEEMTIDLCVMSLAYLILRIKNIYDYWPIPGSTSISVALKAESRPLYYLSDPVFNYRNALMVFLSIIGRLQYYLSRGCNFAIRCHSDHRYLIKGERGCVLFKRATYTFRNMCRSPTSTVRLFRDGVGGPLLVMVRAGRCSPDDFEKINSVIF
jgi:hypothetical protein